METELLESLRTSDPSLTKLHLVFEPSAYFQDDDDSSFSSFLDLLRTNTSITYVLLERRLARALPKPKYYRLLRTLFEIPHLREAEIWSQRLSWPILWSALHSAQELRKLGLGMVTLTDIAPEDKRPIPHATLETFYLSDFRLLSADESQDDPKLDSVLQALGSCPNLQRVEIYSFQAEYPVCESVWPLLRAPLLRYVTLRRLRLRSSMVTRHADDGFLCPLRSLNMSENPLRDAGCITILQQLCRTQWRTTLRELNLKETACTADLAPVLVEEFSANHDTTLALEKLNLAANILSDNVAKAFARLLIQPTFRLKQLELYRCLISNTGMAALAQALQHNKYLKSIGLAYNDYDDEAYVAFGRALARDNRTLESLNLQVDRKRIHDAGAKALQEMCRENTKLQDVSTLLNTVVANAHGAYGNRIRMYLRLNKAGRVKVEDNTATLDEWLQLLSTVSDDFFAVHFLLRTYPNYAAEAAKQLNAHHQDQCACSTHE